MELAGLKLQHNGFFLMNASYALNTYLHHDKNIPLAATPDNEGSSRSSSSNDTLMCMNESCCCLHVTVVWNYIICVVLTPGEWIHIIQGGSSINHLIYIKSVIRSTATSPGVSFQGLMSLWCEITLYVLFWCQESELTLYKVVVQWIIWYTSKVSFEVPPRHK